jgi:hypothetical protein
LIRNEKRYAIPAMHPKKTPITQSHRIRPNIIARIILIIPISPYPFKHSRIIPGPQFHYIHHGKVQQVTETHTEKGYNNIKYFRR